MHKVTSQWDYNALKATDFKILQLIIFNLQVIIKINYRKL